MGKLISVEFEDNLKDVDIAINELIEKVKGFSKTDIYVGIFADTPANPETGVHPVYYGTIHEFGLDGFPERSFLRVPILEKQKCIFDRNEN